MNTNPYEEIKKEWKQYLNTKTQNQAIYQQQIAHRKIQKGVNSMNKFMPIAIPRKNTIEVLQDRNYKEILKAISRKKYRTPKGYSSYDSFLAYVASFVYRTCKFQNIWDHEQLIYRLEECYDFSTPESIAEYYVDQMIFQFGTTYQPPVFTIRDELLDGFYNTRPLLTWESINLFAKTGLILFPVKNRFNLSYILFSQFHNVSSDVLDDGVFVYAMFSNNNFQQFRLPLKKESIDDQLLDSALSVESSLGNANTFSLMLNIFLYQQTEKKDTKSCLHTASKKIGFGVTSKNILTPIQIGESYRIKRINEHFTGTHASPQTHWRSGHWRQQPIGERQKPEYKTIWIEPVLVNA